MLVQEGEATPALLQGDAMELAALLGQTPLTLGVLDGVACLAGEVSAEWPLPAGWRRWELRGLFGLLNERIYGLAGYARQILCWQRESCYCPRCGRPLGELSAQWARHCTNCCYIGYPPVTPAILVLIHHGTRILLARNVGPLTEILPWCQAHGVAFLPFAPLGRGFLTGRYRTASQFGLNDFRARLPRFQAAALAQNLALVERIENVARRYHATAGQVALAWVLAQGEQVIPIPGTKHTRYLDENLGALDLSLSQTDLQELSQLPSAVGTRY